MERVVEFRGEVNRTFFKRNKLHKEPRKNITRAITLTTTTTTTIPVISSSSSHCNAYSFEYLHSISLSLTELYLGPAQPSSSLKKTIRSDTFKEHRPSHPPCRRTSANPSSSAIRTQYIISSDSRDGNPGLDA